MGWGRLGFSSPEVALLVFFPLYHTRSFLHQDRILKTLSLEVIVDLGTGEMVQWIKHVSHNSEVQSWDPSTHRKARQLSIIPAYPWLVK